MEETLMRDVLYEIYIFESKYNYKPLGVLFNKNTYNFLNDCTKQQLHRSSITITTISGVKIFISEEQEDGEINLVI